MSGLRSLFFFLRLGSERREGRDGGGVGKRRGQRRLFGKSDLGNRTTWRI